MNICYRIAIIGFIVGMVTPFYAIAQEYDIELLSSQQEFEWGVRSYNNGFYNDSSLSFSRVVALSPESVLARLWLARSYYASGLPDAAAEQYLILANNGQNSPYVRNRIETINTMRNNDLLLLPEPQYAVVGEINGLTDGRRLFSRPAGIAIDDASNLYISSFASHEVVRLSVNGDLQRAIWKDRYQFDRPYSVLIDEEGILVSEFGKDRVVRFDHNGKQKMRFNRAGSNGLLTGPQYLAVDNAHNIYVSDWGNQRVVKMNSNGNFIFEFSHRSIPRRPLFVPTGIIYNDGLLYIANSADSTIVVSDRDGNYVRTVELSNNFNIEGMILFDENRLLLATTKGIFTYHLVTETLTQIASVGEEKITSLALDPNSTLYTTDFDKNRILILSPVDAIYGGLHVHTLNINSDRFPLVELDVSVRSRFGRPIRGLQSNNFVIREGSATYEANLAKYNPPSARPLSVMLVIPATDRIDLVGDQLQVFITDLLESALDEKDQIGIVTSGTQAVLRLELGTPFAQIKNEVAELIRNAGATNASTAKNEERAFLSAVRIAASELLDSFSGRAIVYIDLDNVMEASLAHTDEQQLANLLHLNSISFITFAFNSSSQAEYLEEFYRLTNADQFEYTENNAFDMFSRALSSNYDGRYRLSYNSVVDSDFGRRYIPLSIIASLYQRSGRDEVGYYATIRN